MTKKTPCALLALLVSDGIFQPDVYVEFPSRLRRRIFADGYAAACRGVNHANPRRTEWEIVKITKDGRIEGKPSQNAREAAEFYMEHRQASSCQPRD